MNKGIPNQFQMKNEERAREQQDCLLLEIHVKQTTDDF
jgi:hypothetical protein